jgi:hypothetical protein
MMLVSVTLEEERISDRPLPPTLSNMDWMPFFSDSCSVPNTHQPGYTKWSETLSPVIAASKRRHSVPCPPHGFSTDAH